MMIAMTNSLREQIENLILSQMMLTRKDIEFIWENDKLKMIRFNDSIKTMELALTIPKDEEIEIHG